jgi:dethiobiotin synthetase
MTKGFFITGTDTGVGKTVITAALVKAAQHLGCKAAGMKPIETGCQRAADSRQHTAGSNDILIPPDGQFLQEISGTNASLDLITPIRFENPLAPMPAAEIEGVAVDMRKIMDAFMKLAYTYNVLIVEGVGGIRVPLIREYFVADMAKDFGLPVIVVTRPGLGTINHTLLTVEHALMKGLTVAGIIINYNRPAEMTSAEQTNPAVLEKTCPVPVLGIFPYLENFKPDTIEKAALQSLHLKIIKGYL